MKTKDSVKIQKLYHQGICIGSK